MTEQYRIPSTPRIISPSPTWSEKTEASGSYFAPITRSAAKRTNAATRIDEEEDKDSEAGAERRSRTRSRSPQLSSSKRRLSGLTPIGAGAKSASLKHKKKASFDLKDEPVSNGHLSPFTNTGAYWKTFSRSPSPLGLIPIHISWRSLIHRYEVPRKALHVSIGFFTLYLYMRGVQTDAVHPWLLALLIPIASTDVLRHRFPTVNAFYVRCLGAFMRENEVHDRYNGVIWYLLGAWAAMRFFPKDIGVMSILLLSWCDTAASTFGRLFGKYTPRISRKKSLAGSLAAMSVGVFTAILWYGFIVPRFYGFEAEFMYQDRLVLPAYVSGAGLFGGPQPKITGWSALGVLSIWSGLVASLSEMVDLWDIDDNLTIPILSGVGLWGFSYVFG